jgi:hypothetical protein
VKPTRAGQAKKSEDLTEAASRSEEGARVTIKSVDGAGKQPDRVREDRYRHKHFGSRLHQPSGAADVLRGTVKCFHSTLGASFTGCAAVADGFTSRLQQHLPSGTGGFV